MASKTKYATPSVRHVLRMYKPESRPVDRSYNNPSLSNALKYLQRKLDTKRVLMHISIEDEWIEVRCSQDDEDKLLAAVVQFNAFVSEKDQDHRLWFVTTMGFDSADRALFE